MAENDTISVLGFNVFSGSKDFFSNGVKGVINTINPHSYIISRKDYLFKEALLHSDHLIPDGVGIKYASHLLTGKRIEKIAGADLHWLILNSLDKRKGSCFYLGSTENTLDKINKRLRCDFPGIRAEYYSPPFKTKFTEEENASMIEAVKKFSPDVLFVGMTAPKQEKWVHENRAKLNVPLICSIGAAFDFYAGTVKRSGRIWIWLGLEWLPRFAQDPQRLWKRNLVSTPLFIGYVLLEKLRLLGKRKVLQGEE